MLFKTVTLEWVVFKYFLSLNLQKKSVKKYDFSKHHISTLIKIWKNFEKN